jgi:capsular exopolysaccharide synthesis family protein
MMDESTYEPEEVDLRAYWETLRKRRWTIISSLLAVVALAMVLTFLQKPKFEAQTKVLAKGNDHSGGADILSSTIPALGAFADQRDVQTQVEIIQSWPLLKRAAEETGLEVKDPTAIPVKVEGGKDTNIITITTTSTDPRQAMELANKVAEVYVSRNLGQNRSSAHAGRVFLEKQQVKLKGDLQDAAKALRDYETRTGSVGLDTATENMVTALTDLEASKTAADADRNAAQAQVSQLRDALGRTRETIVSSTSIQRNPGIQKLQDEIADLQVQRAGLLKDYRPGSVKVQGLDAQIAAAQRREKALVGDIMAGREVAVNPVHQQLVGQLVGAEGAGLAAAAKAEGLSRAIAAQRSRLTVLPEQQYRLAQLQRNVQIAEKTYLLVQDRYPQLRIAEESTLANAQVIEPALLPKAPVSPKKKLNFVLAVLVGLMLGVGIAALQEALDDTITSGEDVERELSLPLLGVVQEIPEVDERSLVHAGNFSGVAEAFRMIRSNVKFLAVDKAVHTLMVTSTLKGEGKSTTSANLAVALARDGRRVTLVDADLRRPTVHKQFGLANGAGLTSAIAGGMPIAEVSLDAGIENLRIVTAGPIPPNPAELLDSARFARIVEELRTTNDIIVFDAPPVLGVADASVLAGRVDGVALVVASGAVERKAARRAVQMLQQARANLLGVILNKVSSGIGSYYDYYYYHYAEESHNGNGSGRHREKRGKVSAVAGKERDQ